MKKIAGAVFAIGAILALHDVGRAQSASLDLLRRAIDLNPTLQSYTAAAQLSATLHVVIPEHKTFSGTVYYLKPKRKIEFQNVPGPLSRFKNLVSSTPTYDEAVATYTITPQTDNGVVSTYSAVPKNPGARVKSVTVSVEDSSALISHAEWSYTNGGKMDFDQTYVSVGQYHLPSKVDIRARFPGYSVDGTLTFSNYQPNASVSPSVFATP